ncbi:Gfo/Idh/MocA family protein [Halocynthiibacter namhaensis]|uniref:Gfo/Idh/MocA family protein n=1 Tax=Halocynthiibacter namhaensis TaxID=1290553 RepID=UPI0005795255|nr:Gfo/Idh/MocA family oxidoreductase [Halocynthiibacter namhaensis]
MNNKLNILVIGAGSIGKRHHGNLLELGAKSHLMSWRDGGHERASDLISSGQFDAAVIATATDIRLELIALCAANDLPIYIEKPLAFDPVTLRQIYEVAAPIKSRSMVGFMMRYHPAFQMLASADLSGIYGFNFEIGHDVTQWRENWTFSESYASNPLGGGVLLDLCHEIDMAHCLFPGALDVDVASLGHTDFPNVDFASRVTMTGKDAPSGTVTMDYLAPVSTRKIALRGIDALYDFDLGAQSYQVRTANGVDQLDRPLERNEMFIGIMRDFLALVQGEQTSSTPHMPRMDRVFDSCDLIARAWQARKFHSSITGIVT